jgi:hypothetical protein
MSVEKLVAEDAEQRGGDPGLYIFLKAVEWPSQMPYRFDWKLTW